MGDKSKKVWEKEDKKIEKKETAKRKRGPGRRGRNR